ncbi:TMEM43 family protein [Mesorhizobium sp. M0254]
MFADAVSANTLITWLLRGAGLLLLTIGFALFLSPIGVILDVIPFLGSMARMGTGIIAFVLAILVGTVTIAIAWFWYRPLLALAILAAGVIAAVIVYRIGRSRRPAVPVVAPNPAAAA